MSLEVTLTWFQMLYKTLVQVQHLIFLDKVVYMQRPTIVVDGENYVAGNKIKVLGTDLGGTNQLTMQS